MLSFRTRGLQAEEHVSRPCARWLATYVGSSAAAAIRRWVSIFVGQRDETP
jgi:hypothetical protein